MIDDRLDVHLDNILKASGSALKHYSMQKTKDDMRQALRQAIAELESQKPVATLENLEQEIYENTRNFVSLDVMEWMLKRYYTHPPQRKCENCGEFGTCCLKTESQERNFCPRCGKRTNYIHTCTPPRDNT